MEEKNEADDGSEAVEQAEDKRVKTEAAAQQTQAAGERRKTPDMLIGADNIQK